MIASKRLDHIKEYYFSRKLREVGKLIAEGKPVINLGIGSPDLTAPKSVEAALVKSMNLDVNRVNGHNLKALNLSLNKKSKTSS